MKAVVLAILCAAGTVAIAAATLAPEIQAAQAKAQAGDAEAQFQLGEAYRGGKGVTADTETAIMWYRRAAAQGHIRASEELGFALFAHGERREAMPYIEKAAARGAPWFRHRSRWPCVSPSQNGAVGGAWGARCKAGAGPCRSSPVRQGKRIYPKTAVIPDEARSAKIRDDSFFSEIQMRFPRPTGEGSEPRPQARPR